MRIQLLKDADSYFLLLVPICIVTFNFPFPLVWTNLKAWLRDRDSQLFNSNRMARKKFIFFLDTGLAWSRL